MSTFKLAICCRSQVKIKHYSVAYFDHCFHVQSVLTFTKSRVHMKGSEPTFQFLTVSCIPATGCYVTFQYLTVSCIPTIGHAYDISIPDSFMYTCYRSCT